MGTDSTEKLSYVLLYHATGEMLQNYLSDLVGTVFVPRGGTGAFLRPCGLVPR
jgi:hypothetical protein